MTRVMHVLTLETQYIDAKKVYYISWKWKCYQFFKGQLISEQIYAVLNFPKIQRNIARISALASKIGQIKNVKAHYHPN